MDHEYIKVYVWQTRCMTMIVAGLLRIVASEVRSSTLLLTVLYK
jgi:hypothetical protein